MEIMFRRAVFPGFFGSEDAPTTATLFGLKNAPNVETSCMIPLRSPVPALRDTHPPGTRNYTVPMLPDTGPKSQNFHSNGGNGIEAHPHTRERIITFRV